MYPMKLTPPCKDYLWGGSKLRTQFHKQSDKKIIAESWELSCHKDGPSVIANGEYAGKTLQEYINEAGKEALGAVSYTHLDVYKRQLVFILFLGSLFYILRQIYSLRRELLLQDVRLPIQPFNVKSRTVFGAFSALFLIAPISCGYIAATPNPVQTSYSVIETDSSEQMADIRHRLLSNDLPEEMVMVLPPQELQRLAGMDEMSSHWQMYTVDEGNLSLIVAACRLDSQRTRLLYWFSWDEAPKHGFRDTIAPIVRIDPYFDSSFNSGSFQNPDETLLLLTQKDGQLYSMMPAAVRHSSDGTIQSLDVRVFPDIEAQYILYAITLNGDTSGYAIPGFTLDTAYTHRSSFFCLPYTDSSSSVTTALTSSYQHYVLTSHFRFNVESSELEP